VANPARGSFDPVPSVRTPVPVTVVTALPDVGTAAALAVPVIAGAEPPADLGTDSAQRRGHHGHQDRTEIVRVAR